jgi:hypothetical protein
MFKFTVEKLVAQVDRLSQAELAMIDRQRCKELVLALHGSAGERRAALETMARLFAFDESELRKVSKIVFCFGLYFLK